MVKGAVVKELLSSKQHPKELCSSSRPVKAVLFSRRSQTTEEAEHAAMHVSYVCCCGAVHTADPVQQFYNAAAVGHSLGYSRLCQDFFICQRPRVLSRGSILWR